MLPLELSKLKAYPAAKGEETTGSNSCGGIGNSVSFLKSQSLAPSGLSPGKRGVVIHQKRDLVNMIYKINDTLGI